MTRREDWPARLQAVIAAASSREFDWSDWNCCLWLGECIEACTGSNPVAEWAGRCTTAAGAARILTKHFGGSLQSGWTQLLGEPIPPLSAGRGDVCLVQLDGEDPACGVVDLSGEHIACLSLDGLEFVPLSAAVAAWSV
jgi:hypothetical protein